MNKLKLISAAIIMLILSGCLTSSHHFRSGKTIESGEAHVNYGFSIRKAPLCESSDGNENCREWTEVTAPNLSRGFRLGVRDSWGPFTGVDAGYQLEVGVLEFDMRLGLPHLMINGVQLYHSLGAGWAIGSFPDNSYFLDYVISRELKQVSLFLNTRQARLATQLYELEFKAKEQESGSVFKSNPRWLQQYGGGVKFYSRQKTWIIPDAFHLTYLMTAPEMSVLGTPIKDDSPWKFAGHLNFGIGWDY
jgi:hypothetical protein